MVVAPLPVLRNRLGVDHMDVVAEAREPANPALGRHTIRTAEDGLLILPLEDDLERGVVAEGVLRGVEVDDPGIPHHRLLDQWHHLESLSAHLRQELGLGLLRGHRTIQDAGHGRSVSGHRGKGDVEQSVPGQESVAERLQPVGCHQLVGPGTVELGTFHALHIHGVEFEDAHRSVWQHELVLRESTAHRVVNLRRGPLPQLP